MKSGMVLLDENNRYVSEEGKLPLRPDFDKEFLIKLVKGRSIICGDGTWRDMPKSIKDNCVRFSSRSSSYMHDVNLGIITFYKFPPDLMFVVKARANLADGKKLKQSFLDKYEVVYENDDLKILILI